VEKNWYKVFIEERIDVHAESEGKAMEQVFERLQETDLAKWMKVHLIKGWGED